VGQARGYLSSSFFIISTTSSGNLWICLWLKSIVTPGFSSLLTPLASAAFVWFSSRAFFIASRASATTCAAEIGICEDSEEFDAACRTVVAFGSLRTVFRGGGLGKPLLSSGRPVDWVAVPSGPDGRSIATVCWWTSS
jgi:hypothetical protein